MTTKNKSIERLITDNYVSKTTIQRAFGCGNKLATEIFNKAKEIELEKCLIDPRPMRVQSRTVMQVTNTNYNYMKKQHEEEIKGA